MAKYTFSCTSKHLVFLLSAIGNTYQHRNELKLRRFFRKFRERKKKGNSATIIHEEEEDEEVVPELLVVSGR